MKKGYPILIVFAVWCVISAIWYMFSVKGLPDNTGLIKPSTTTLAIAEIIVMLTASFLIGFWMAWVMRSGPVEQMADDLRNSGYEIKELQARIDTHTAATDEVKDKLIEAEQKVTIAAGHEEELKKKNRDLEAKLQQLNDEFSSAKFRMRIVESDLDDKTKQINSLKDELTEINNKPQVEHQHRDWSDHPFVRPVIEASSNEKDDLTEIKGIGPAFQKKLNLLDIYSFRQLSELDGESVSRLAELIEVFPERIHRDNWIGQATRLYMKKLGKEV